MKDLLRKSKVSLLSFVALGCFAVTRFPEIQNALALVVTPQGTTTPETKAIQSIGNAPGTNANSTPRSLSLNLSLVSPDDLKVKTGMSVQKGQIISDRAEERRTLSNQHQTLQLSLKQIESRDVLSPKTPLSVPAVKDLPPISYAAESSAISSGELRIRQAERAFQLAQTATNSEPLSESASVSKSAVAVQNQQRLVDNQLRKIDAVALLKDLPPEVADHEQEKLKQLQSELEQTKAEYKQSQANLGAKKLTQTEKLQSLAEALEKARAEHQLAIAHLQSAKDRRAYQEYEASITEARRAEERNQTQQSYSRQLLEMEQHQRDRDFQIAQLKTKIAEVDEKLSQITAVTSPYNGKVRKIVWKGQSDRKLNVELTLDVVDTKSDGISQDTTPQNTTPQSPTTNTTDNQQS